MRMAERSLARPATRAVSRPPSIPLGLARARPMHHGTSRAVRAGSLEVMSIAARLTLAGVLVAAIAVLIGTTVVPTHVTFGAGAIRCTVLRPDRNIEVAPVCGPAGANHLRATLAVGAFLAVLAVVPVVVQWRCPGQHLSLWTAWGVTIAVAAVLGVAWLGLVEYSAEGVFFDL